MSVAPLETAKPAPRTLERYSAGTRVNHWIVAMSFVLAALSGLAMFHPSLFWLSGLFGGGPWMRILHPFLGLLMVAAFAVLALKVWGDNALKPRDWTWLKRIREVAQNREENLPEVGRYNGGQKLLFFTLVVCLLVLLISGVLIWRQYFSGYFPIDAVRVAALAHAFFAFVLITSIIVHIYAGIWVKGSVRAMTRGRVSFGWAFKHHRLWFRDVVKQDSSPGSQRR